MKNQTLYRQLLGVLQYVTNTRPDVTYAVNLLSRFMHKPTVVHWQAAKKVLRYLKGTLDYGLHLGSHSGLHIFAFYDGDWAVSIEDRKSVGGFCIFLGNSSRKQGVVSCSSLNILL